ncbi:ATP-dependent RNA helicase DDX24 [Orussus abietinus]|uniref:ATP-dependent RNA helicase DDX24 n=1 Tax=Orussus abietinus TaxID=222816 RepID=UPI000626E784|nr:ATP-dependent RNA helicase DDX24 [Orussus abietinus]
MKVKKVQAEWVPLKLEGPILSEGIGGLIGVEELTHYKLQKGSKFSRSNDRKRKINHVQKNETDVHSEDDFEEPDSKKRHLSELKNLEHGVKKKKKKNNQNVKKKQLLQKSEEDTVNHNKDTSDADKLEVADSETNINVSAWTSLGVPPIIIKALADQNFEVPTAIQNLTLPPALLGRRDILGAAETGSGKTLAFGIPVIAGILELKKQQSADHGKENVEITDTAIESDFEEDDSDDSLSADEGIGCVKVIHNVNIDGMQSSPSKPLYALILTPTRELAIQIKNHLTKAAKYTDIKIAVVVGGMAAVKQERILKMGPEIVIATPGRLWELMDSGEPHLSQVNAIRYLVIDETDRMLEKGHFQELHKVLEKVNADETLSKQRRTYVFSATLTMVHDIPEYLKAKKKRSNSNKIVKESPGLKLQKVIHLLKMNNPKVVDVTKESGTAGSLTECCISCPIDHKDYYIYYFLKRHSGRTLVFCNSIGCVKRLAALLGKLECNPLPLHASMQQRQRLKNLERFQADDDGLLIATDVAARGLDIPSVEHVIHYQVPRTSESYVHRSGRTARAQKEGITVLIIEPSEVQYYTRLCRTLGRTEELPVFPVVDSLLIAIKERVNLAREIDKLELRCRRDNVQKGWLKRAVENMDIVLDEDQLETTMETKESADLRRQLKAKNHQLTALLRKPLFPKGFSGKYPDFNIKNTQLSGDPRKAVDVMKQEIEINPKRRKLRSDVSLKKKRMEKMKKKKDARRKKKNVSDKKKDVHNNKKDTSNNKRKDVPNKKRDVFNKKRNTPDKRKRPKAKKKG